MEKSNVTILGTVAVGPPAVAVGPTAVAPVQTFQKSLFLQNYAYFNDSIT